MRMSDIKTLNLRSESSLLSNVNVELTSFKITEMTPNTDYNVYIKELSDKVGIRMDCYYYCLQEYIRDYIFVIVWSNRVSAIEISSYILNYTKHKLKDVNMLNSNHDKMLLVLKKESCCNNW